MSEQVVKEGWFIIVDARVNDDGTPIIENWIKKNPEFEKKYFRNIK